MHVRLLLLISLSVLQAGCASHGSVYVKFGEGRGEIASVSGRLVRDADLDTMTVESISLQLGNMQNMQAPEFTLRFSDGSRVSSGSLTANVILNHGASAGTVNDYTVRGIRSLVWSFPKGVTVLFMLKEERVIYLEIEGPFHCPNVSLDGLAIELSNGNVLTFPLPYGNLRDAFGKPTSVERFTSFTSPQASCPR